MKIVIQNDDGEVLSVMESDECPDRPMIERLEVGETSTAAERKTLIYCVQNYIDQAINQMSNPLKRRWRHKK